MIISILNALWRFFVWLLGVVWSIIVWLFNIVPNTVWWVLGGFIVLGVISSLFTKSKEPQQLTKKQINDASRMMCDAQLAAMECDTTVEPAVYFNSWNKMISSLAELQKYERQYPGNFPDESRKPSALIEKNNSAQDAEVSGFLRRWQVSVLVDLSKTKSREDMHDIRNNRVLSMEKYLDRLSPENVKLLNSSIDMIDSGHNKTKKQNTDDIQELHNAVKVALNATDFFQRIDTLSSVAENLEDGTEAIYEEKEQIINAFIDRCYEADCLIANTALGLSPYTDLTSSIQLYRHKMSARNIKHYENHASHVNNLLAQSLLDKASGTLSIINITTDSKNFFVLMEWFLEETKDLFEHVKTFNITSGEVEQFIKDKPSKEALINMFIDRCYNYTLENHDMGIVNADGKDAINRFSDIKLYGFLLPKELGESKSAIMSADNLKYYEKKFAQLQNALDRIDVAGSMSLKDSSAGGMLAYDEMDGHSFERFCAELLKNNGFDKVEVTSGSGDYGVDILAEKDAITYAIQCKRSATPIGNKAIQEIYSGRTFYKRHVGVVITNNYFTSAAIETADKTGIILWDRDKIEGMM